MKATIKPYYFIKFSILKTLVCWATLPLLFKTATATTITWTPGFSGLGTNWNSSGNCLRACVHGSIAKFPIRAIKAYPIPLAVNSVLLPKHSPLVIGLGLNAIISGRLIFERTQLDSLPKIYELWLMDKYKKDSLDIRNQDKSLVGKMAFC